jgi:hypothetical protein
MLSIGYIINPKPGYIAINPNKIDEAKKFCSTYVIEWGIVKETEFLDGVIFVGGTALLNDMLNESGLPPILDKKQLKLIS